MTAFPTDPAVASCDRSPDTPDTDGERTRRGWFWVRVGVQLLMLAVAGIFVARRAGQLSHVGATLAAARWPWLLAAGAALAVSISALARLQQTLLREGDTHVRLRRLLLVTLASNAVTQSLPGGAVVAEGYTYRQYRRIGAPPVLAVWTEVSAGALEAAALALVAFAGALLSHGTLRHALIPALAVVLLGALVAAALFRRTRLLAALTRAVLARVERVAPDSWCRRLEAGQRAAEQMRCYRPSLRTWLTAEGLGVVNWVMDAVALACVLEAVHAPVPWHGILLAYAGAQLLAELPITPGGLGLVEGGLVGMLTQLHLSGASATAGALLYRGFSFWSLIVLGWLAALRLQARHGRRPETKRADSGTYPDTADVAMREADVG